MITTDAQESLNKVCHWGHKKRKGWDKTSAEFHDQTIFLTRKNFGPSGYAPVGSMCYRTNSCTLNDDDGFPSAFIVAHETGHTLGMEHDGDSNNCTKDVIKGSIMAPLVRSRFDRFYWSRCSRQELISHLNYMWCLDDVPIASNRSIMNKLPGQIYDIDEQCLQDFGKGYFSCLSYLPNPCQKLWCDDKSYGHYCRTRNTPPLEGTTCGERMWCRLGKCVPMTSDGTFEVPTPKPTPKPIDGGWSSWSAYGPCSKSCGQGVKVRARSCTLPSPKFNGKKCQGYTVGISFCQIKLCSGSIPSLRQTRSHQCQKRGTKSEWFYYDVYRASLDCDFEDGLCGWLQDDSDEFDWTPIQGKTPSSKTGPIHDHTKGPTGKGTYLFIETSRPTNVGWRARLVSRLVAKHVSCLSFWYHSFGDDDHFGALELHLNTTTKEKVIWGQSGNKGNQWKHKLVTILSVMPYRVS
ncbi:A disintegrin and metalloproteinase with thrombospondin motifs 14-like [Actinia tenebrosa]|uniref:A disintegrin and metalloproteinase with thrombospondin motifs 14-like n=1 Tax=Actinia tenebrosa TaxID=6105 RepID=A0A6P8J2E6_ACTTE|nr:A disintegrin and metalloproteinase with thrombospondin motifs 14-like [Actinia tenebrosa]